MPLRHGVRVEQDFLGRLERAPPAAVDRVLLALLGPAVVPEPPIPERDRDVGLLDPAEHFAVERLLQLAGRGEHRLGVGALLLEVGPHGGVVALPEPEVVARQPLPVQLDEAEAAGGERWSERGGNGGGDHRPKRPPGPGAGDEGYSGQAAWKSAGRTTPAGPRRSSEEHTSEPQPR